MLIRPLGYSKWPAHVQRNFDRGVLPPGYVEWPPIIQSLFNDGDAPALNALGSLPLDRAVGRAVFSARIAFVEPGAAMDLLKLTPKLEQQIDSLNMLTEDEKKLMAVIPIGIRNVFAMSSSRELPQTTARWMLDQLLQRHGELLEKCGAMTPTKIAAADQGRN